jgi:uncharacterized DUF497 family protein
LSSSGTAKTRNIWRPTKVTPAEFEQVLNNDPLDLDYEAIDGEERYRSVGLTNGGRFLRVAWTVRNGKVRAVTAFRASASNKKAFLEKPR